MNRSRLEILWLSAASIAALLACNLFDSGEGSRAGCTKDTDCKGDRICQQGTCVDDPGARGSRSPDSVNPPSRPGAQPPTPPGEIPLAPGLEPDRPPANQKRSAASPRCTEEDSFCELSDGSPGFCKGGVCQRACKKGHILFGGTHCAKPCRGQADCPGGECEEGVCSPLCPPACPYRW